MRYLLPFLIACLLGACRPSPQYQDHVTIPGYAWTYDFRPAFSFTVTDTQAAYQLFFLIRHTDAYPYNNIWLMMETKGPGDTTFTSRSRVEIPLAMSSGQWIGRGMGEVWEQRVAISTPARPTLFPKSGTYTIRLTQDMRRNPLPEVWQAGLRLEKLGRMNRPSLADTTGGG